MSVKFPKIGTKAAMSAAVGGIMVVASSSAAPIAFNVVGLALGTGTGLAVTASLIVASTVSTCIYCYKNKISFADFKNFVRGVITNLIWALGAAAAVKKVKKNTEVVSEALEVTNSLPVAMPGLGGFAVGYAVTEAAVKAGVSPQNSIGIGDGASKIASSLTAHLMGTNVIAATLSSELGRAVVPVLEKVLSPAQANIIGAGVTLASTNAISKVVDKFPQIQDMSSYNTAVFVGTGTGKVAEALLKHFGYKAPGQIKDGFSIMTTSLTACGLGANPYGAVFGLTLSQATSNGVQKLAIFAKLPSPVAEKIGDVAGTMATPVLGITAKTMFSYFQLPTSGALETITYGVGVATEGFFKESRFKDNAKELGFGASALTSFGGAAITGANPLALIVASLFSTMIRTGVKKAAIAAKCEEETADNISTAVGVIALPVVGLASTKVAVEYPQVAMTGVAVATLLVAYQCNVHGYVAQQVWTGIKIGGVVLKQHFENQQKQNIFMYGSVENAWEAQKKMSRERDVMFKQQDRQIDFCKARVNNQVQQPKSFF